MPQTCECKLSDPGTGTLEALVGVPIGYAEDVVIAAPLPRLSLGAGDHADRSRAFRVLRKDDLPVPTTDQGDRSIPSIQIAAFQSFVLPWREIQ